MKDNNYFCTTIVDRHVQLPSKQKELLIAICKEGKAKSLTSSAFIRRYHLPGSSSVQSAIKGLLEKNFVTATLGEYEVYDKFFALWILQQQGLRTS